jgi:DASS family divalent anion:Na+ symporter
MSSVITKTNLGVKVAYTFIRLFGRNIYGLAYSLVLTELVAAPLIPSNTARGANIGLPIVTSISRYIAQHGDTSEKSIGAYLAILYAYSNSICSCMFITAMISNAIIVESVAKVGLDLSWLSWFRYMLIPGFLILLALPFILF